MEYFNYSLFSCYRLYGVHFKLKIYIIPGQFLIDKHLPSSRPKIITNRLFHAITVTIYGSAKYQHDALDPVDCRVRRLIGNQTLVNQKLPSLQHQLLVCQYLSEFAQELLNSRFPRHLFTTELLGIV